MKTQRAPQLATSLTGTIDGSGSVTKDKYPALVANKEAILNAGAAEAFAKLMGMSINEFNAIYAPKGAETKVVDGVLHAAAGASGIKDWYYGGHDNAGNKIVDAASRNIIEPLAKTNLNPLSLMGQDVTNKVREGVGDTIGAVIDNSSPALISKALSTAPAPSVLPPTNQASVPKPVATNDEVANMVRGIPNPVANVPEFTPTGGVRSNVATGEQQTSGSTAPSLLPTAKINNPSKLDYETMPAGFNKQVQKNGNISYSDRPMTAVDAPVPLLSANNSTPQSRRAIQEGVAQVQTEAQYKAHQEPSIITPEIQLRMQQGLPVDGSAQPSIPTVSVQPPVNNLLAGNQSRPKYDTKVSSAEADSRDLSQRQMANDTPNAGAGKFATQAQLEAAGRTGIPLPQVNTGGGSGQGGSVGMGGEGGQALAPTMEEAMQARDKQAQTETPPPPSINNGRLVQQPAPQLLTPTAPQPKQRGFVAPQIQGILSPENQAALNEQVSRNLATMNRGTGNMSDALATKYAQKSMDTILGKDTQDRSAAQANNNQAQDESQYQRTEKQKQSEEAWNQLLQSDTANYGKLKDQKAAESAQQNAQSESSKAQLEQLNKDKDRDVKLDTPVKVGENDDGSVIYKSPRQVMQERSQAAANENMKKLQYAAENEKDPTRRQQAIDALNKLAVGQR